MSEKHKSHRYRLHVKLAARDASSVETGRALGALFRQHLHPRMVACTTEIITANEVSRRAEAVILKLLARASPWALGPMAECRTREVLLNDHAIQRLARHWEAGGISESALVVPHMFYLPLLKLSTANLQRYVPELLEHSHLFFDYTAWLESCEIARRSFLGERARVLRYLRQAGSPFVDSGRQLFLENLISLAAYMIPARSLIFKDDDFFLVSREHVQRLIEPLERGFLLSGMYHRFGRLHTCFFGMRPEALRDQLALFDDGENTYASGTMDTGSITYRAWRELPMGVHVFGRYEEGQASEIRCEGEVWGRHLRHCSSDLWNELPGLLNHHFCNASLALRLGRETLDADLLLESLALLLRQEPRWQDYEPTCDRLRLAATEPAHFSTYVGKIYSNHHWLLTRAATCRRIEPSNVSIRRPAKLGFRAPVAFVAGGIGDYLLALPAVNALAGLFPERLSILYQAENRGFLFDDFPLRRRILLPWVSGTDFPPRIDVPSAVRAIGECDLFLSLVPWESKDVASLVDQLSPESSVGFQPHFEQNVGPQGRDHAADFAFRVPRSLDPSLRLSDFAELPPPAPESRRAVDSLRATLPRAAKILAVHLHTDPMKMWSHDRSTEAIHAFLQFHPDFVAVFLGSVESSLVSTLEGDRVIPWYGTPLMTSLCLIAQSDLFLGVDSCMLHAADLARIPGVGLFGPTKAQNYGFRVGPGISIQAPGSLDGIMVDQVVEALETMSSTGISQPDAPCLPRQEWLSSSS